MPLNLTTPTVRPPTSLEVPDPSATGVAEAQGGAQAQTTSLASPSSGLRPPSGYQPAQTANRADSLAPAIGEFAQGALANPSRYDSSIVQQGIDLVNAEMERAGERGTADLDEFYSSRGLVGSDVEERGRRDFLSQLDDTRSQRLFELTREMANTFAADRNAASQIGINAGNYMGQLDTRDINEARYGAEFGRLTGNDAFDRMFAMTQLGQQESQFARSHGLSQEQIGLEAQRLQQQAMLEGRSLDIREATSQAEINLREQAMQMEADQFAQNLQQQESQFSRQYGLSQQELGLEAQRLQQQAQLEGRSLDIQEATSQAEIGLRAQQLVQEAQLEGRSLDLQEAEQLARQDQFDQNLGFQREELAAQLGLSREELDLQREELSATFADRQAQRVHELGLQEGSQEFEAAQNSLNRMLEQQALELQRYGLDSEMAWRDADRQLEAQLEGRALDLQEQGMDRESAYQQALVDLEALQMSQAAQIANQQAGLSAQDIYLRALAAGAGDYGPLTPYNPMQVSSYLTPPSVWNNYSSGPYGVDPRQQAGSVGSTLTRDDPWYGFGG